MGTMDRRGGLVPKYIEFWNLGFEIDSLNFVMKWQDGPSQAWRAVTVSSENFSLWTLWRVVVPATVRLATSFTKFRDNFSLKSLWRSVVPTTVHPAMSLWSSESCSQYPIFQNSKCFGMRHPRRSVVPMTVRRGIRRLRQWFSEINSAGSND